jgi:hypothetical protein
METIPEEYPFITGFFTNADEESDRIHRVNGQIDEDIKWLNENIQAHCTNQNICRTRIAIERIEWANQFCLVIEQATEMGLESVLKFIHDKTGPEGTRFWFDCGDDDCDDPITPAPCSHFSPQPSMSPSLAS